MLLARKRRWRLVSGIICLALAWPAALPALAASDAVTTGVVKPADPLRLPRGSALFHRALELLRAEKYSEAYTLARGIGSDVERRTIQWAAIYFGGTDIDYATIMRFAADAPHYASAAFYKTRIERSLLNADAAGSEVIRVLGGHMPDTVDGQIALAYAYKQEGQTSRAAGIARTIWAENFLDRDTEKDVLEKLGDLLDRDAHWARAVHLMMNDRAQGVERIMHFLSPAQQSLAMARNATSRKEDDARALLDKVDPTYRDHPVAIFSRAQLARQAGRFGDAIDWLDSAGSDVPDATLWWNEREALIRQLLAADEYRLAYQAAAGYRHGQEGRLVEARFYSGWIALSFLNDANSAATQFAAMRKLSTLPDSIARADYWLARARTKLKDRDGARAALTEAAGYGTIYYGLLAREELGLKGVEIRSLPDAAQSETTFAAHELVQAVQLLADNGAEKWAAPLMRTFAAGLKDSGEMVLAARLAQAIGAHDIAISIADTAERRGIPLDLFNFPKDGLPTTQLADIDKAAIYAVARQESHFRVDAMSRVGARGLMQLMPGTAQETAERLGIDYSAGRLVNDGAYNALLGSTYLAAQLKKFDGSLLLAAAAYNAGASNATKWIAKYGDPRLDSVDPVNWVECIPFAETRKYVQRVLGNYLVYRARLGDTHMTISQALRRIAS
jgi:soluble lytic murein transglycosylase